MSHATGSDSRMKTELVSIATDSEPLDAAFYTPDGPARGGILIMHGNVGNFYTGPPRFLPPALVAAGFACLAFNRRGHDVLVNYTGRGLAGGAFQTTAEGRTDNDVAAAWLAKQGFAEPIVIGHSNGGMLAADFAARRPQTAALVLLSAQRGGERNDRVGPPNMVNGSPLLAGERHEEALAEAKRLVAEGRPQELMLLPGWWRAISAESLIDRAHHTPDTVAAAADVRCPVMYLRGELEAPAVYPAERFKELCPAPCEVVIAEGCDHWYAGREDAVAAIVVSWLGRSI